MLLKLGFFKGGLSGYHATVTLTKSMTNYKKLSNVKLKKILYRKTTV